MAAKEEAAKGTASGATVAAIVAGGAGEAGDGATIDPRQYWWWQCQQICNPSKYQKVLKAKLMTLFTVVDDFLKRDARGEPYRALLRKMFRDKTLTLKSYNLKALQCTVLLTDYSLSKIEDYDEYTRKSELKGPGQAIGRELKAIYSAPSKEKGSKLWHKMDELEAMIRSNKESIFLPLLVEEDSGAGGGCCPVKPDTAIATPLGTMTFMELLESLNQDIFFIGVVLDFTMADGYEYSPFEFFAHDLFHMKARIGHRNPEKAAAIQKNVANFLSFLRTVPEEGDRYLGEMILFMVQHEAYSDTLLESWAPIENPVGRGGLPVAWDATSWTTPRYGPLIPKGAIPDPKRTDPVAVMGFLHKAGNTFRDLWNAAVVANPSGEAVAGGAPGPNFSAKATENASAWNEETFTGGFRGNRLKKTLNRRYRTRVQRTRRRRNRSGRSRR